MVTGEGGSGGALGLAIGDRVLMQQYAVYSVIPPEGCAAILWRDAARKVEAAEALKMTAPDLLDRRVIDSIVPEPLGGAQQDPDEAARMIDLAIGQALAEASQLSEEARLEGRYKKFRHMGRLGTDFVDLAKPPAPSSQSARSKQGA
jgi:acetyl-CoA carboxylase carboxyl transferase subunit alpha